MRECTGQVRFTPPIGFSRGLEFCLFRGQVHAHSTWLELVHKKLDEAVFAAYGWPSNLSDEEILERLLVLNLERAGEV